jgi:hypothetical protein
MLASDAAMKRLGLALAAAFVVVLPSAGEARAPRCDGDFQLIRGAWVSTPYCRADQIARVARERGVRTSAAALLAHPADAEEVCRFVGSDPRVHPACEELYSIFHVDIGNGLEIAF